jgi:hypothetical protein
MSTPAIIALVIAGLIVGAVIIVPPMIVKRNKAEAAAKCAELQARRAGVAVQGGDVNELARLDQQIKACAMASAALGNEVDLGAIVLENCVAKGELISQEWAHYRSTDGTDAIKRNNTRGTWLRMTEEMTRCFAGAIDDSTTFEGAKKIQSAIRTQVAFAESRAACFDAGVSGCSRYGLNEPHNTERATDERNRGVIPLREQLARIDAKIAAFGSQTINANVTGIRVADLGTLRGVRFS